ncbi:MULTISPECIES: YedE family putative selenium transporter [unclassified Adlercreutzia]|uniref:YedE family putative selenium transporter n=1 Tax=unclassified Adlercreutzia TaxID=2636013 RepID=UPI0013EC7008|nr:MULTISPECIES: YedE family putative selenium transporter [unclassified Adlercreutzia]
MDTRKKEITTLVVCGLLAGAVAVVLAIGGNPKNMAICVACFIRDIAGGLGLHSAAKVQYIRPEIIGIVVGALIMAIVGKEYKATAGSSPLTRFFLGFMMVIGALVFLGCPLRMVLRMAAGDLNAWIGLVGFAAGIVTGVFFLKKGFSLGRAVKVGKAEGIILPVVLVVVLVLSLTTALFKASTEGPGSMHAVVLVSTLGGLVFGAVAQKSRMCFAGGLRDTFLVRDFSGLITIGLLFGIVLVYNLVTGGFKLSMADQPIAHSQALWNILGLYVVGFAAVLLGGCPLRQLALAGSGSGDSAVTFLGMLVGAACAHNFNLASSTDGATMGGQIVTIVCIVALFAIAAVNLKKRNA